MVVGADHIKVATARQTSYISSIDPAIAMSDGMRSVPRTPDGCPLQLRGYGEWTKNEGPDTKLLAMLREGVYSTLDVLSLLYPPDGMQVAQVPKHKETRATTALTTCLRKSGCPCVCVNMLEPEIAVEFVPARNEAEAETATELTQLSSIDIRAIIRRVPRKQRGRVLAGLVMNAQLLSDMIDKKSRRRTHRYGTTSFPRSHYSTYRF
jgi:hypothetical protein